MKFVSKLQKGQTAGGQAELLSLSINIILSVSRFFSQKNSIEMIVFKMMATKICLTGQVGDARCIS